MMLFQHNIPKDTQNSNVQLVGHITMLYTAAQVIKHKKARRIYVLWSGNKW